MAKFVSTGREELKRTRNSLHWVNSDGRLPLTKPNLEVASQCMPHPSLAHGNLSCVPG